MFPGKADRCKERDYISDFVTVRALLKFRCVNMCLVGQEIIVVIQKIINLAII